MVPPSPRGADEIANCTRWLAPSDGMTCEVILTVQHISSADFFKMNPSVGEDCSKMSLGTYYCVSTYPGGIPSGIDSGDDTTTSESSTATKTTTQPSTTTTTEPGETPSPVQDGMTDKCNEFYKVKKGDGCDGIAKDHDIARDDFHKWNPAVKKDCTLLIADYYVCVGVKK